MNTTITRNRIVSHYTALDEAGKALLLAKIAYWFTIIGRGTYEPGEGVQDPQRLREVNEAIHRVLDQLHSMLASLNRRPDGAFADLLADLVERLDIEPSTVERMLK